LAYPSQAAQDGPLKLTSIVTNEHMLSMVNGLQQVRLCERLPELQAHVVINAFDPGRS
jgi:hypothetical protein